MSHVILACARVSLTQIFLCLQSSHDARDLCAMSPCSWRVAPTERQKYERCFRESAPGGYVSGQLARSLLGRSGLPTARLRGIWDLADADRDGALNEKEFVVSLCCLCC